MEPPERPKLKLSFSNLKQPPANTPSQTPLATPSATVQTPLRTPSIKLKLGNFSSSRSSPAPSDHGSVSGSRKRKQSAAAAEAQAIAPKPRPIIKLRTNTLPGAGFGTPQSAVTPGIRLKTKGKIPRRPLGVGYDSELDAREVDPVILEGMILRMLPGDDCEYIRTMINEGKVGVSRLQGGADIRIRMYDTEGRRGLMYVRGNGYAITVVDLPTITEGLKSWDKKNWIKSIDICQMMLVLGRCKSDEEAREFPLPGDVNPKNYQYAHGLTPPMHWVRKRRFEKTSRARLDDIERIERKLNHLLAQDRSAKEVKWAVLDHDPREDREMAQDSADEDDDSDADGEVDDQGQSYFPDMQYTHEEVTAIEDALFNDDEPSTTLASTAAASSALPSDSAEPDSMSATPAAEAEDADADDDNDASSADEDGVEGGHTEERLQKMERIRDLEAKIKQKRDLLKGYDNPIMKRKTAKVIQGLENDKGMLMRSLGMGAKGGDESEEE